MPLNKFFLYFNNKDLIELSKEMSYNKVLVFNLGFDEKSKYTSEHWIYIPEKKYNFYRIGFYDNILDGDKLSMYIEIGYPKDAEISIEEIDRQLQLTLENLQKIGIINKNTKLLEYVSIIMDPAYVHINGNVDKKIKKALSEIANDNIYSIGRYGAWTYCSMEDSMVKAKELALKLNK